MVEDHRLIVEGEGHVGHVAIVRRGVGEVFQVADHVVACIAHGPAHKRRQLRQRRRPQRPDPLGQLAQGVVAIELPGLENGGAGGRRAGGRADRHPLAIGLDLEEGVGRQEAVAAHLLAADHALGQAGAAAGVELVKGGDGGQRVAHQPAADRHQVGLLGQAAEAVEIGVVAGLARVHKGGAHKKVDQNRPARDPGGSALGGAAGFGKAAAGVRRPAPRRAPPPGRNCFSAPACGV